MKMQCAMWHTVMMSRITHQGMADCIKLSGGFCLVHGRQVRIIPGNIACLGSVGTVAMSACLAKSKWGWEEALCRNNLGRRMESDGWNHCPEAKGENGGLEMSGDPDG